MENTDKKHWQFALPLSVYITEIVILFLSRDYGIPFSMKLGWLYPILPAVITWVLVRYLKKFSIPFLAVIYMIMFGELFTLFFNHSPYSVCIVNLVAETTETESAGFAASALSTPAPYAALAILALITAASWGIIYGTNKIIKRIPQRRYRYISLIVLALLTIGSTVLLGKSYYTIHLRFNDPDLVYFITHRDDPPAYYTSATRILEGAAYVYSSSSSKDKIIKHLKNAKVDSCTADSPTIILVIGESYNKHHTPLYEPNYRNTTPYMCALKDSGKLIVFNNVVAPYNHTDPLLHTFFSTCSFDDRANWTGHTLFPAIFRKADYDVFFLSNQFAIQSADVWNQLSGGIFNKRDLSELQYTYHNKQVFSHDGELLNEMPDTNTLKSKNNLVILHLMGQHVEYSYRYPEKFAQFNSGNTTCKFGGKAERQRLAEYDNSILYNDYVIYQVINKIKSLNAILIYFADHGEECYDWRDLYMRTDETDINANIARNQFEVPFVIYMTESYKQLHPEYADKILNAKDKPMLNTDIPNMLFHLAGIHTPDYIPEADILSDKYCTPLRILNDNVNYDEIITK